MTESTFSKFGQVGIIVKDIEKTIEGLSKLGIGPFGSIDRAPTVRWEALGKPTEVKLKMRFANIGPLEIELIEPISECMQKEFLDSKGEGIHHIAFWVDDLDKEVKKMTKKSYKVVQQGWREKSGGYAYLDTQKSCGVMIELIQK